jgi:GT2 family glycosyltransferase
MTSTPRPAKVALVLPVHDRRALTLRALRSLGRCRLEGLTLHVIVVDDGSRDGTSEAVQAAFPEVELRHGDGTLFYAGGTNLGLRAALDGGAEYVLAANDDTIFDFGALAALVSCARAHPRSVVGALLLSWSEPHRVFQVGPRWRTWSGGWHLSRSRDVWSMPRAPFEVCSLAGNCLLVPAEALREVGLMDARNLPQHGADLEWCVRLRRGGWRLLVEPRARVFCQPNTPPSLSAVGWGARVRALLFERTHPHNLRVLFLTRWRTAPTRLHGLLAFSIFVSRLAWRGLVNAWRKAPRPAAPVVRGAL